MARTLTWTKTVSTAVDDFTIANYTYDDDADTGIGESDQGLDPKNFTISTAPTVIVDCDENRNLYPDDADTEGFTVKGSMSGDDAPYNLRIVIRFY